MGRLALRPRTPPHASQSVSLSFRCWIPTTARWCCVLAIVSVLAGLAPASVRAQTSLPAFMYTHDGLVDTSGLVRAFDLDPSTDGNQQYVTVSPGQQIRGLARFRLWSGIGNPYELGQAILVFSWVSTPPEKYRCLYDGPVGVKPGVARTATFRVMPPGRPGTYYIWAIKGAHYSCSLAAAEITVLPPASAALGVIKVTTAAEDSASLSHPAGP